MSHRALSAGFVLSAVLILLLISVPRPAAAQGIYLSTSGPVHRGMGGASTAAPLDAIGAMYWNPATISGLQCSELAVGVDLIYSNHDVASTVGPFSGVTEAENGFFPVPALAWVHHTENPAVTFGVGLGGVAGFKTNLMSSTTNPVLAPQPMGLGRVSSEASFMQLTPALSLAVTDRLSIAVGPVVTLAQLALEPFVFEAPNLNGYPSARSTRYHWGGGAQAGIYYIRDDGWHLGASVKTPAWMEEFRFFSEDAAGAPRTLDLSVDLPAIVSLGTAYSGLEYWVFAADVRYFDYSNTDGLGDPASFTPAGALQGVGWESVWAVALGVQHQLSERLFVRTGYTYNQNPIADRNSFFNIASPLIYEHMISAGVSYQLTQWVAANVAYSYVLPNDVTGPLVFPGLGPLPGTSVTNSLDVHVMNFGVTARY